MQLLPQPPKLTPAQRRKASQQAANELASLVDAYAETQRAYKELERRRESLREQVLALYKASPGLLFRSARFLLAIGRQDVSEYVVKAHTRTIITVAELQGENA